MGKAGRWLRNFFLSGRKGRKAKDNAETDCQSVVSAPLSTTAAPPSVKEKRRWSFRRPASKVEAGATGGQDQQGPLASSSSHCFSEAEVHVVVVAHDHHAVIDVATTAPVASLPPPTNGEDEETAAAIVIQAAYRSYLARKALCALRGMVKLQAMVRGQLVRRQADVTLRRMQALVDAQRRARDERLRLLAGDARYQQQVVPTTITPGHPPRRRSPLHPRSSRKPPEDHVIKIVELDNGGAARRSSCHSATPGRTPAMAEVYGRKVSPTPSALTDSSLRTLNGRFDDASLGSAAACERGVRRAASPSYMANTESSRAKAARRSQSAPRQRLSSASEPAAAASPYSPSCCGETRRPPSAGGGARRRASLDPMDLLPGGAGTPRRASRARASSLLGSECGSSSTVGHRGSGVHAPWQG